MIRQISAYEQHLVERQRRDRTARLVDTDRDRTSCARFALGPEVALDLISGCSMGMCKPQCPGTTDPDNCAKAAQPIFRSSRGEYRRLRNTRAPSLGGDSVGGIACLLVASLVEVDSTHTRHVENHDKTAGPDPLIATPTDSSSLMMATTRLYRASTDRQPRELR